MREGGLLKHSYAESCEANVTGQSETGQQQWTSPMPTINNETTIHNSITSYAINAEHRREEREREGEGGSDRVNRREQK